MKRELIPVDWPAPANVRSLQTTRTGGFSVAPYDSLNLGDHVGDDALTVTRNRQSLNDILPSEPVWLEQVHGVEVVVAETASCKPCADACISRTKNAVCVTMTADCLPVLLCDQAGTVVAAAHAGWRGLADGVIEATVKAMNVAPGSLMAWLGPAIGSQAFQVGEDVRDAFLSHDAKASAAFTSTASNKYLADIYQLARQRLNALGITQLYGGGLCTYTDQKRFFSFRRDGATGRMASLIWLA
ncbi:MAG: peptidoglycan editing factor PgeF [Methylophilales bacterium]|nr:peptidoglycan editing factor PgeF [Methylophilales bacterium]